jgi:precorrin-6B methylase 2
MKNGFAHHDPSRLLRYRDSIYASDLLLCAVAYFDFFTFLKNSPRTHKEICNGLGIRPRPADVLLTLLLSLELVKVSQDKYGLTDLSAAYFVSDSPDSLVPYYCSLKNRPQCLEFCEILKTDKPAGWSSKKEGDDWIRSMGDAAFADSFTSAMDSRGVFLARKLAGTLDFNHHRLLLDVAGGSGIYACSIARRHRHIKATVLEIPPVDEAARRSIERKHMQDRVDVVTGNMFEVLPSGYDLHLFANVFHDWDHRSVRMLSDESHRRLEKNGAIVVFDAHLNDEKSGPIAVAEYSCLLMHSTQGRCYSTKEIRDVLRSSGFEKMEVVEVAADRTAIVGKKK